MIDKNHEAFLMCQLLHYLYLQPCLILSAKLLSTFIMSEKGNTNLGEPSNFPKVAQLINVWVGVERKQFDTRVLGTLGACK